MKASIGLIIKALDTGGAEKQCLILANTLKDEFNVFLFVQKEIIPENLKMTENLSVKVKLIQLHGNLFQRTFQFVKFINKKEIAVIISYLTIDNTLAALASVFTRVKVIAGIRNCYLPKFKLWTNLILQCFFFERVLFNNYTGRDALLKAGFKRKKTMVIPNTPDVILDFIKRKPNNKVKIISIGRFTPQKDFLTAMLAIKHLKTILRGNVNIDYTIIGYGKLEGKIREWQQTLGITDMTIEIKPENINKFYQEADILLCTSIFEGMPNVILEALNYSLPVISTNVGDVSYLIRHEKNGYIASVKDYITIANYLQILVNDYYKRILFGMNGHHLLVEKFSINDFRKKYIDLINELTYKEDSLFGIKY